MEAKKKPTLMTLIITFTEETKSNTDEPYIGETGADTLPLSVAYATNQSNNRSKQC